MKTLVLNLTVAQFARFELLARLLKTKPEHFAVSAVLGNIDAYVGNLGEWLPLLHSDIEFYGEKRRASKRPKGSRFEDTAPARLLRLVGRGAKEVSHV